MGTQGHDRMILASEIIAVQSISKTAHECSRNLGVHFNTYKKYATMHGLYGNCLNRTGKGTLKPKDPYKANQKLNDILENKYPNADRVAVLRKLVKAKVKKNECEICGFNERRISDDVVPLILCFKDTNHSNFELENLEVCCFNCAHNLHDAVIVKKPKHMHKVKVKNVE